MFLCKENVPNKTGSTRGNAAQIPLHNIVPLLIFSLSLFRFSLSGNFNCFFDFEDILFNLRKEDTAYLDLSFK